MKSKLHFVHCLFFLLGFCISEVKAQSPRLQLLEYFDNTSIPPFGAVANANVDSLMLNYSNKITCIKYHVAWGSQTGTDPMNLHNPTQPQTRVNYYKITADPHAKQDGGVPSDSTFSAQPSTFSAAMINKRSTVTSPFTIKVSHFFNTAKDTIFTKSIIKKTGNTPSVGKLAAHVVVIEKLVYFATAPGVSGDKVFHNVMKQMLPGDTGTALPSMNIGDSVVLNLSWKLTNVYDENQLAVVSFVQNRDSAYREVLQAGYSPNILAPLDAGIISSLKNLTLHCDSMDQVVILKNFGSDTLKSCKVYYKIDNNAPDSVLWTGSLPTNSTASVSLHLTGLQGMHNFKAYPGYPNGGLDMGHFNDTIFTTLSFASAPVLAPISEGFQGVFSPANWNIINPDQGITWKQSLGKGGFGYSNKSVWLDFFTIADTSQFDDLYLPMMDLSADTGKMYCTFNVAYARFLRQANDPVKAYLDTLQVNVSTNCGATWATVYSKSDTVLKTAPDIATLFSPSSSQWRAESIDLSAFVGMPDVQIRFRGMSGFGNSLYIDDINMGHSALGVADNTSNVNIALFPNPTTGSFKVDVTLDKVQDLSIEITNILGETLLKNNYGKTSGGNYPFDLKSQPSGIYFVKIFTDGQTETKKIILNK